MLHKNGQARNNTCTLYLLNSTTYIIFKELSTLVDKCRRYSKPKQTLHDRKDPISGVHVSPGSAETLIRRGRTTNHHPIAYSLVNISAKNYQNRSMCVKVIVCNVSVVFWDTMYVSILHHFRDTCIITYFPKSKKRHVIVTTPTQGTVCNPSAKTSCGEPVYKISIF